VAKHYGRLFTEQSLREKAQIGKEGVSMLSIAEAAEAIGFRTMGVKISFDKLAAEAPRPCIVHWDQNHFVVVYAIKSAKGNRMSLVRPQAFRHDFGMDEGEPVIPPINCPTE